jgi:CheY-like chemotaxis protein
VRAGNEEATCSNCGIIIGGPHSHIKTLQSILAAEDTPLLLRKVAEMLELKKIAHNVVPCRDGEEFLEQATSRLRAGLPVSLAILDVQMPILNGVNAAIALRAVERARNVSQRIPIIFFTSTRCDETFQKVLKYCAPARYINKGAGSSPEEFADRLYQVIAGLLSRPD